MIKNKSKVTILIPTNGKRPEMLTRSINSVLKQTLFNESDIVVVSEGKEALPLNLKNNSKIKEIVVENNNGIFMNFCAGAEIADSKYLFLMDDDIEITDIDMLKKLTEFLETNLNVWAVGPFIDENKGDYKKVGNVLYDIFKKVFRIWDPDDYTNKIYSCFGKGSANHQDRLPKRPYIGCQWLTNQALMIRKDVFDIYHGDDLNVFTSFQKINRIWAVDFYLTHRLYVKNVNALAFYPHSSVLHLGAHSTSFNKGDRVLRETVCGYYYYLRFLRKQNFITAYALPCVGRLLYLVGVNIKSPKNMVKNVYFYFYSFALLFSKRNELRGITAYE